MFFFQKDPSSNFPSTSVLTECVSDGVPLGVVCLVRVAFGQGPRLTLTAFYHCERGGRHFIMTFVKTIKRKDV